MPYQTVDLNWDQDIPDFNVERIYKGIIVLVWFQDRPVGLVRVNAINGVVSTKRLKGKILAQIGDPQYKPPYGPKGNKLASVVVCTRERPQHLAFILAELMPFYKKGYEIIIVDNAPLTDFSVQMVKEYPYQYLVEPEIGLNHARNCGLKNASHEIIAFTDDDCVPDKGWLEALTGPYVDETVWGTTGLVIPLEVNTSTQERFEDYCANRRIFRRRFFSSPPIMPSEAGIVGMGANMSFRREVLEKLGGFDPRFDGGTPTMSGGDTEIFARVLESGGRMVYRPDALVRHRHVNEEKALRKIIYGYGVGLFAFLTKRLVEEHDVSVIKTAPKWILGPPYKALLNRLLQRPAAPWDLVFSEFTGSLRGPIQYYAVKYRKHFRRYTKMGDRL
jgi:GT2 family glycosyltransferase